MPNIVPEHTSTRENDQEEEKDGLFDLFNILNSVTPAYTAVLGFYSPDFLRVIVRRNDGESAGAKIDDADRTVVATLVVKIARHMGYAPHVKYYLDAMRFVLSDHTLSRLIMFVTVGKADTFFRGTGPTMGMALVEPHMNFVRGLDLVEDEENEEDNSVTQESKTADNE